MGRKLGTEFVKDMVDRGRRELGGIIYSDSNIAQPMYPLRGGYEPPKESGSVFDSRMRDHEPPRNEPERGMDRD